MDETDKKIAAAFPKSAVKVAVVIECDHSTGEWSSLLKVRARSTADLDRVLTARIKKFRGGAHTNSAIVSISHEETHVLAV